MADAEDEDREAEHDADVEERAFDAYIAADSLAHLGGCLGYASSALLGLTLVLALGLVAAI